MSGILKPLIYSTNVESGSSDPINIDSVSAITRETIEKVTTSNAAPKFTITFHLKDNGSGTPNAVAWKYVDETTRDTDFTALLTAAATTL